jgi:hypothetical protein
MRYGRSVWAGLVALAFLGMPVPAFAQGQRLLVESHGGLAVPAARLADLTDVGPSFGLGVAYEVAPRVSLFASGDLDLLDGADLGNGTRAPDLRLWHYRAGVQLHLVRPEVSRWTVMADLGLGATTIDSERFAVAGEDRDFRETYFSTHGGIRFGYAFGPRVTGFLGGRVNLAFADEDETRVFADLNPEAVRAFDRAWTVPLLAGVNVRF